MNRAYREPVNVQAETTAQVRVAGRLYTVRAILEHWVVNREWWQDPEPGQPEPGQPEPGQPDPRPDLEFWRVEASAGQGMAAGVYELRRESAADAWTLRVGT